MGLFGFFGADRNQSPKMKTINYRGGVVEFRIPSTWKEEYSDTDGGVFYEDKPNSGTLRLKIISVTAPPEVTLISPVDLLNKLKQVQGGAQLLPNGNAFATFVESSVERGTKIKTFYWFVSNPLPPKHARLATFSYTILQANENTPQVKQECEIIEQEIRVAEFSSEIGTNP
jgi:hypothetical protein